MKHVLRFIGAVVVIVVLAVLVLYFLNGQGYIKGPLSTWIENMQIHLNGAVHDTQETIDEFRGTAETPTQEPQQTPGTPALPDLATEAPTVEPTDSPEPIPEG